MSPAKTDQAELLKGFAEHVAAVLLNPGYFFIGHIRKILIEESVVENNSSLHVAFLILRYIVL